MNRLFLLFHGRFPSEKAASLFTAKGAEAFALAGQSVTVVVPRRRGVNGEDPFGFYGIEENFEVAYVPTLDLFGFLPNRIAFLISFLVFSITSFFFIKNNSGEDDIIYSNETLPLLFISSIRGKCFFEMHDFPESKFGIFSALLTRMKWVLVHNRWKLAEIGRKFPNIPKEKFIYEPNAVDLKDFDINVAKEKARQAVSLPEDKKIAVYTGHLYGWKGVDTLAIAAELLDDSHLVVFVGGTDLDVSAFRGKYGSSSKIMITGHRPHTEIPLWQKVADVLVLPNSGREAISTHYTSPMKLFEYMASRRPIIASDIPSIREILDDENALLVPADDPQALASAIGTIVHDDDRAERISARAYSDVLAHTWQARAGRILDFIKKDQ